MGYRYGARGGSPLKQYFKTPLTVTYCCIAFMNLDLDFSCSNTSPSFALYEGWGE